MCYVIGCIKGSMINVECRVDDKKPIERYSGEMNENYDKFRNRISEDEKESKNIMVL